MICYIILLSFLIYAAIHDLLYLSSGYDSGYTLMSSPEDFMDCDYTSNAQKPQLNYLT